MAETQNSAGDPHPGFAPCPTCQQYSHSLRDDMLGDAILHFKAMIAHPVRGTPMHHVFDDKTRDIAERLVAHIAAEPDRMREVVERCAKVAEDWAVHDVAAAVRNHLNQKGDL